MTPETVYIRCRHGHESPARKVVKETDTVIQQLVCPKCGAEWESPPRDFLLVPILN
jgi:hypothetical protein